MTGKYQPVSSSSSSAASERRGARGAVWSDYACSRAALLICVLGLLVALGLMAATLSNVKENLEHTDRVYDALGLGDEWDRSSGDAPDVFARDAGFAPRKDKKLIFYTCLSNFDPGNDGLNSYYEAPGFVANGWNISYDAEGVTTLTASPYNVTMRQAQDGPCAECLLDHYKALAYYDVLAFLPNDGTEVFFGGRYSCDVSGLDDQPFGDVIKDVDDDIRLAGCSLSSLAFPVSSASAANRMGAWTMADVAMSKGRRVGQGVREFLIYGIYGVLPNGADRFGGNLGDYWAGVNAVPLERVRTRDGWVDLALSFNRRKGTIRYWVNGRLRHTVTQVGKPGEAKHRLVDYGGSSDLSYPSYVSQGRKIGTYLDAVQPNNPKMRPNRPLVQLYNDSGLYVDVFNPSTSPSFLDPQSLVSNRLFGQRTTFKIFYESRWEERSQDHDHDRRHDHDHGDDHH